MSIGYKKPLLPPDHVIDAVQRQMDWSGADARTALAALQQESKVTEFSQVDRLPVGTVVKSQSGSIMRKVEDEWWESTGADTLWHNTYVLLPAHVLTWGKADA